MPVRLVPVIVGVVLLVRMIVFVPVRVVMIVIVGIPCTALALRGAGSVTVSPEVQPGTAQLAELRERIREADAVCVFAEPQFQPQLVDMLTAGTTARTGVLDPIGVDLPPGATAYPALMRNLANALADCLAPSS
jgi:zinc transport system substrate-binding protein